ncbi:MAG: hypothetical protein IJ848_01835 [Alphaproteobacteria bacterium]|nr:hypothetical protein [Alphaproteobacteria bacterium]
MKKSSVFFSFIYMFSTLLMPLCAAPNVTYLPNHNNNRHGPMQSKNNNNMINGNSNTAPQFSQGNSNMPPAPPQFTQNQNNNNQIYGQNNNTQYNSNNNYNQVPISNQQYNPNNNMNYNNSNYQNNLYQNNNYQGSNYNQNNSIVQDNIDPNSLIIIPANSNIYYIADQDLFPIDMIQQDTQGNDKGFWLYLTRVKDIDAQTMERIKNEPVQSDNNPFNQQQYNMNNNLYNNSYNNGNDMYPYNNANNNNYQYPGTGVNNNNRGTKYNNNPNYNNNVIPQYSSNSGNTFMRGLQYDNNGIQQLSSNDVVFLDGNSNNTTLVSPDTQLLITPVEVNGSHFCSIKAAEPNNNHNNNISSNGKDNLPTLNNLVYTHGK